MIQHQRFHIVGALVAFVAAPTFSLAADTATDISKQQPTVSYRAENATEKFSTDATRVTTERRADGSRSYHLNGEGMQSITAHIGADGKLVMECSDEAEKALVPSVTENNAYEK